MLMLRHIAFEHRSTLMLGPLPAQSLIPFPPPTGTVHGAGGVRPHPQQGGEPGRGRGDGRGHPGRRAGRRRDRRAAVGRDAPLHGHRDPGRRVHQAHHQEHHHSDQEVPG